MKKLLNQSGFTLVELMIATSVFALTMLLVTVSVIYVSNIYVKGNIESSTQDATRAVLSNLSRDIQFNKGGTVSVNQASNQQWYYCIGNDLYVFDLNKEVSNSSGAQFAPHALVVFSNAPCPDGSTATCFMGVLSTLPATLNVNCGGSTYKGVELLGSNMRLGQFNLAYCPSLSPPAPCAVGGYTLNVTVGYGDDISNGGVLSPTLTGGGAGCTNYCPDYTNPQITIAYGYNYICGPVSLGGQFCATSTLTTNIFSRIQ